MATSPEMLTPPPASASPVQDHPAPVVPVIRPGALTASIDASCRDVVLALTLASLLWLVIGLILGVFGTVKLHAPGFLANSESLTVGRVRPAAMSAIIYGFAMQAALAVAFWLLSRLCGRTLPARGVLLINTGFWNIGVFLGLFGIFSFGPTGFEWLEMPPWAAAMLFVSFVIFGVVALSLFANRREHTLYATQWYVAAAFFYFAWIYSVANLLLLHRPVRGVLQANVNAWFTASLLHLWFSAICLGAIYYFLPKILNKPLYSSRLASFGFWTLAIIASWTGPTQFIGGPLPAWMTSTGVAANLVLIVPLCAVLLNWHLTAYGEYRRIPRTATIVFLSAGILGYTLVIGLQMLYGMPVISRVTHFTLAEISLRWFALLGFVAPVLFGSLYFILPRVTAAEWPSVGKKRLHFWCTIGGAWLLFLVLFVGGLIQGLKMNVGIADFIVLGKLTVPFIGMSSLGLLVFLAGQVIFIAHIAGLLRLAVTPWLLALRPAREPAAKRRYA